MKALRDWLKDGDPVANEPMLSDADVQRMRRAVVSAGDTRHSFFADWARGAWAAATVVVALTIAVSVSRWQASSRTVALRMLTWRPLWLRPSPARGVRCS